MKTKEEQLKDFQIIASRATQGCKFCYGRGYQGYSEETKMFVPCICVMANIQKEVEENQKETPQAPGVIEKIRTVIGLN